MQKGLQTLTLRFDLLAFCFVLLLRLEVFFRDGEGEFDRPGMFDCDVLDESLLRLLLGFTDFREEVLSCEKGSSG